MRAVPRDRSRARVEILFGFCVTTLGALIGLIWWLSLGSVRYSSNIDVQSFASAFAFLASLAAWWFLSQIIVESASRRSLVRRALIGLMLDELFLAIASLAFVIDYRGEGLTWSLVGNGLIGLGALLSGFGFYSLRATFRDGSDVRTVLDAPSMD